MTVIFSIIRLASEVPDDPPCLLQHTSSISQGKMTSSLRRGQYLGFTIVLPFLADELQVGITLYSLELIMRIVHQEKGSKCLQASAFVGSNYTFLRTLSKGVTFKDTLKPLSIIEAGLIISSIDVLVLTDLLALESAWQICTLVIYMDMRHQLPPCKHSGELMLWPVILSLCRQFGRRIYTLFLHDLEIVTRDDHS